MQFKHVTLEFDGPVAILKLEPLVGRENHEIRIETSHIHGQHAGAVRCVDQEGRSPLPECCADFLDVDQPAVRPVHR